MSPAETRSINAAIEARRALVLKNMCDLMRAMGQDGKFDNPDDWMDSIVERPRPGPADTGPHRKPPPDRTRRPHLR